MSLALHYWMGDAHHCSGPPSPKWPILCRMGRQTLLYRTISVLTAIFPGEPGWAGFVGAKADGGGGDNWSYKSWKAPVKSSPPPNQHPTFLQAGWPSCRQTYGVGALKGKPLLLLLLLFNLPVFHRSLQVRPGPQRYAKGEHLWIAEVRFLTGQTPFMSPNQHSQKLWKNVLQ